jgi:hypothetical protein
VSIGAEGWAPGARELIELINRGSVSDAETG